jgi:hypothetical protein
MTMQTYRTRPLRIGCATGFWGDTEAGAAQLVARGDIDYLVFDFLAEITMSLLARARAKSPEAGYVPDFVRIVGSLAGELKARGIKVVSNAGGVNPAACGRALAAILREQGIDLKVAVIDGDDLSPQADALRAAGVREMFSGEAMPEHLLSVNAYLGAQPIAAALDAGADIVVTGRVVDSAVTLGPLVHEFGWQWNEWDKLATGSLAGHVIECGTQCTGGLFTDWERVPGWDDMGFPIAECEAAGRSFVVTKPPGTGGLLEPATVAEQIVYEIGDPRAYLLPDVCCDFSQVGLAQDGTDRVKVHGARGRPAPRTLKVSATHADGWRLLGTLMVGGRDAARKAQRVGEAVLARSARLLAERGGPGYARTSLEVLGAESSYGPHARAGDTREVVLKIAARHAAREPLELLAREIAPSATAMAPGITGFAAGRPAPSPVLRLFSFRVDRALAGPRITVDGVPMPFEEIFDDGAVAQDTGSAAQPAPACDGVDEPTRSVALIEIAHGRSGDKGDMANIGIIAREPAFYPVLLQRLTADAVRQYMAHVTTGAVRRYELPGFGALNFMLEQALDGGGTSSLRYDPQGKAFAQMLLDMSIEVPVSLLQGTP